MEFHKIMGYLKFTGCCGNTQFNGTVSEFFLQVKKISLV